MLSRRFVRAQRHHRNIASRASCDTKNTWLITNNVDVASNFCSVASDSNKRVSALLPFQLPAPPAPKNITHCPIFFPTAYMHSHLLPRELKMQVCRLYHFFLTASRIYSKIFSVNDIKQTPSAEPSKYILSVTTSWSWGRIVERISHFWPRERQQTNDRLSPLKCHH